MTKAERQARWRARHKLRQQGLEEVKNLWAKPEHHAPIRQYAEQLKDEDDGIQNDSGGDKSTRRLPRNCHR